MQKATVTSHRIYTVPLTAATLLCSFIALVQFARFYYFFVLTSDTVMHEMGFSFSDAYPKINGRPADYIALDNLQASSAMYRAGFRDGDILLDYPTGFAARGRFVRKLDRNRGNEIAIKVVDAADGPPLKERSSRTIKLVVPL